MSWKASLLFSVVIVMIIVTSAMCRVGFAVYIHYTLSCLDMTFSMTRSAPMHKYGVLRFFQDVMDVVSFV